MDNSDAKVENPSKRQRFLLELDNPDNETQDTIRYREGYPGLEDNKKLKDNYKFYKGSIKSKPNGEKLNKILKEWKGKYDLLEIHHGYIQWLFPIREQGMNIDSHALQKHEIEELLKYDKFLPKLKQSYELMLDFYGMKFKNPDTGELCRTDNYQERYENLSTRSHNYLRITRILKCLGEFSLESYQVEFIRFLAYEVFVSKELQKLAFSLRRFWVHTIKNDMKRRDMIEYVKVLTSNNQNE